MISSKKFFAFLIVVVLLVAIVLFALYAFKFDGGLSDLNSDWGSFGSYFGGTITPFLSFLTILIIIITNEHQKKSLQDQIENQKTEIALLNKQGEIEQIEDSISQIRSLLMNISQKIIPSFEIIDYYNEVYPEYQFQYDRNLKLLIGTSSRNADAKIYFKDVDIFTILANSFKEVGKDRTKQLFVENKLSTIRTDILTYMAQSNYLIGSVLNLHQLDSNLFSLRYHISLIFQQYGLLYKLGLVNEANYSQLMMFQYMPSVAPRLSVDISSLKEGVKNELNDSLLFENKITDISKILIDAKHIKVLDGKFEMRIWYEGSEYVKTDQVWSRL